MRRSRHDPPVLQLDYALTVQSVLTLDAGAGNSDCHPALHLTVNGDGTVGLDLEHFTDEWAELVRPRSDEPWDRVRWVIARGPCMVDLAALRSDVQREPIAPLLLAVARGIMHRRDQRDIAFVTLTAPAVSAQKQLRAHIARLKLPAQRNAHDAPKCGRRNCRRYAVRPRLN